MGENEDATVRTLTTYREVMGVFIQKHRGRVVHGSGDSLLAEFVSVVDSVRCAVEIQKELKTRNAELPEDRKVKFRMGINPGDVIEKDDDLHGDGVNIAARVEALAEGEGICITRTAYDHVKKKLNLGYEYLGEHTVKNIAEPVRVYRVLMDPEDAGKLIGEKSVEPEDAGKVIGEKRVESKRGQRIALAIAMVFILIVGGLLIWRTASPPVEIATEEKMGSQLPEKLSIAVLPFTNMSGDPKQEYFSDGITEEIITQLARFPDVHVIARNSTFTYKGKPVKIQQVGQELGVRYVLEGSVLRFGDRVRITAQLVDAATGGHIWAERYDRENEDIFALQDDISQHIAAALGSSSGALEITERKRVMSSDPNNLSAFDTFLRATEYFQRYTKDDNLKARKLAIKATELKPDYAQAYGGVGWTHLIDYFFRWTESPEKSLDQAFEWAQKALAIDSTDYESYWLLARIYTRQKKYDKALASAQRALSLNPNSALLLKSLGGNVFTYLGRAREAAEMIEKAMRLDPRHSNSWYGSLGRAYYAAGQYEKAVKALKHIGKPKLHLRLYLAASYAQLGQTEEAQAEIAQILKIDPKVSVDIWAEREPYKDPVDKERWIDGLRKAGLPE
jgi:adenylate cyclase